MSELRTRDGKILKGLGTWEQEQLKKMDLPVAPEKPKQKKGKGRKPFDTNRYPMLFIGRLYEDDAHQAQWTVKPVANGVKYTSKVFRDCIYGGRDAAYKEALAYRDEFIKQQLEKINAGKM